MSDDQACGFPFRSSSCVWSGFQGASSQPGIDLGMSESGEFDSRRRSGQIRGMDQTPEPAPVILIDHRVPFRRLVWHFFRIALAAFPAFLIVGLLLYATVIHAYLLLATAGARH